MAATFVPFFEKTTSGESLPQYQFSQYRLAKVTLTPPQSIRHVERDELKTKVVSDLRNALSLSLPAEALHQILTDLTRYRASGSLPTDDLQTDSDTCLQTVSTGQGDKPIVKLQKDGEKVTHIIVECECGQVITMDCVY